MLLKIGLKQRFHRSEHAGIGLDSQDGGQGGVVFDQHFSCCPICAPYRGQLLTGKYPHKNGVIDNEYRLFDNQVSIADALNAEGYRTAFLGE
jgi:arylsulfatase A-like enzyme